MSLRYAAVAGVSAVQVRKARAESSRIYDFRSSVEQLTNVPPTRQKIVGLGKGKLDTKLDSARFGSLELKKGGLIKFTLIGTPEAMALKEMDASIIPEVRTLCSFLQLADRRRGIRRL